jgi:large subunit ribosomal protein L9
MPDAIKAIGEYKVAVKTGYQTTATVIVQVVPEIIGDVQ